MPKYKHRSLALSAILASSVLPVVGLTASTAHAVNAGAADSALTISNGTSTVIIGGKAVTFPTTVTDATWAPDGSRLAYVDAYGNLVSSLPDGSGVRLLARGGPGIVISHPTWDANGGGVLFGEKVDGKPSTILTVRADGYGPGGSAGSVGPAGSASTTLDPPGRATSDPDIRYTAPYAYSQYPMADFAVWQQTAADGTAPEIWVVVRAGYDLASEKVADGTQPTASADGNSVAFVNAQGQIAVADLSQGLWPPPVRVLTTDGLHKQHPTYSPDGSTIAYEAFTPGSGGAADVAKDVETIPATGGAPTVVSATPGFPAYRTAKQDHVTRLAGADRIGTAIAISQARFPGDFLNDYPPNSVVLSRSDQFADALAGSFLAKKSPLLLTPSNALDPAVKAEIQRVLGLPNHDHPKTVYLLGGQQALSPAVQSQVEALGYNVKRLGGADRYETSVIIAKSAPDLDHSHIEVATGNNFADALSAGATGYPVVLTNDKAMPAVTADYLKSVAQPAPHYIVPAIDEVGGQAVAAVSTLWPSGSPGRPQYVIPLAGADRYETSLLVAREFFAADPSHSAGKVFLGVSTALNWPDSLAGGAMMNSLGGALLLADPKTGLTADEQDWVSAESGTVDSALVFGGPKAIATTADSQLGALLSGPAGYVEGTNPPSIPN